MTTRAELNAMTTEERALHYRMYTYRREIREAGGAGIMAKDFFEFWTTSGLERDFDVRKATFAPGVISGIVRHSTREVGSLLFGSVMGARFYFRWSTKVGR